MKKTLSILLALSILLLSLCACNKVENETSTTEASTETTSATDSTQNTTESTIATVATEAATEPSVTQPPATKPSTTKPSTTKPSTTKPSTTKPSTTKPSTTKPSATKPPANNAETSFDDFVAMYSGRWYLDGYFDVYLDISSRTDADHNRNDTLMISANNFSIPDPERDDGIIYPDLQGLDGYCSGFGMTRNDYDSSNLENYKRIRKISFNRGYISIGSYKFVTKQGGKARVAGITLNKTSLELFVGESETLIATIFPEGAINKEVIWSSSNDTIATVSQNGKITGISASAPDYVVIGATSKDGEHMATCNVIVNEISETVPPVTEPPVTEPPVTEPPVTEPPVAEPPVTEPPVTESPVTEPPVTEPPVTESPVTEPPVTEPTATEPVSDVLIINDTRTISDQTINTDVYITSTGVATFNNVTVNGNVYCYGKLTVSGCHINNVYAYYWDMVVATGSCPAWDGTHGSIKGLPGDVGGSVTIKDYALDYAFDKWGKK